VSIVVDNARKATPAARRKEKSTLTPLLLHYFSTSPADFTHSSIWFEMPHYEAGPSRLYRFPYRVDEPLRARGSRRFHHDIDDQWTSCCFWKIPKDFAAFDEIEIGVDLFLQRAEMHVDVVPRQMIGNGQEALARMVDLTISTTRACSIVTADMLNREADGGHGPGSR
jgi:hypothetical protein